MECRLIEKITHFGGPGEEEEEEEEEEV